MCLSPSKTCVVLEKATPAELGERLSQHVHDLEALLAARRVSRSKAASSQPNPKALRGCCALHG
jgi:hypothetical protein